MDVLALIEKYIESKQEAWSPTTLRSELSRLMAHSNDACCTNVSELYGELKVTMKPYAIKTTLVRLGEFRQWLIDGGYVADKKNPFKVFLKTNANKFKNAYKTEVIEITYEEAKAKIELIEQSALRIAALQLLEGGLRSCELGTIGYDYGYITGKGGKRRQLFLRPQLSASAFRGSYNQLYYALRKIGLKPHMLRKLCASRFARQEGVDDIDIMEAFGWNSIETSKRYRQPRKREELANLFERMR